MENFPSTEVVDRLPGERSRSYESPSPTRIHAETHMWCTFYFNSAYEYSLASSPEQLSKKNMIANMAAALVPFYPYLRHLAQGKLDGYIDSFRCEEKVTVPGMVLSAEPQLLLYQLGETNDERINNLFTPGTRFMVCYLISVLITDLVLPQSATCTAPLVREKHVSPSMDSVPIGAFTSPAEARLAWVPTTFRWQLIYYPRRVVGVRGVTKRKFFRMKS